MSGASSSGSAAVSAALDLFSRQSTTYAKFRPTYPPALFDFVRSLSRHHSLAWDVGTGNGQAAVPLAERYKQVIATDISPAQISNAKARPLNLRFAVTPHQMSDDDADRIIGPPGSVDLVTVAQAMHWFDFANFNKTVRRVLRPEGGAVAAWSYGLCRISPAVDAVMDAFYAKSSPFWEPQRQLVDDGYRTIPFDFRPIPGFEHLGTGPVSFEAEAKCSVEDIIGFLDSWSATQTAKEKGVILLDEDQRRSFQRAWAEGEGEAVKTVVYPIFMRIGTI